MANISMIIGSDIIWFDDDVHIGSSAPFPPGVWRLEKEFKEDEYDETQADVEELGLDSGARGVFISSTVSGSGLHTATIKSESRKDA